MDCPVCSLLAAVAALGTNTPTRIEHVGVDENRRVLRIILRPAGRSDDPVSFAGSGNPGPGDRGRHRNNI